MKKSWTIFVPSRLLHSFILKEHRVWSGKGDLPTAKQLSPLMLALVKFPGIICCRLWEWFLCIFKKEDCLTFVFLRGIQFPEKFRNGLYIYKKSFNCVFFAFFFLLILYFIRIWFVDIWLGAKWLSSECGVVARQPLIPVTTQEGAVQFALKNTNTFCLMSLTLSSRLHSSHKGATTSTTSALVAKGASIGLVVAIGIIPSLVAKGTISALVAIGTRSSLVAKWTITCTVGAWGISTWKQTKQTRDMHNNIYTRNRGRCLPIKICLFV